MANIREYNAGSGELHPSETGVEAFAQEGRRVGAFYHQLGADFGGTVSQLGQQWEQHETMQEISQGSAGLAALHDDLSKDWNSTASQADPNDRAFVQKWRDETMEPRLQEFANGFHTDAAKRWALEQSDALRQHMFEKTSADASTLAGDALVANLNILGNRASATVRDDPTSFNASAGLIDNSIAALTANSPYLSADVSSKVRTELADKYKSELAGSAALGMIERNPTQAITDINDGRFANYLDAQQLKTFTSYAEQQVRMGQEATRAAQTQQDREDKQELGQEANRIQQSLVGEDGTLSVGKDFYKNVAQMALLPGAQKDPGIVKSLFDLGRSITNEQNEGRTATTDPHTYESFANRLALGPNDPNALTTRDVVLARAHGGLSDHDYNFFKNAVDMNAKDPNKQAAERQFNFFVTSNKAAFTQKDILGNSDPQGMRNYYQFAHDARMKFENAYATGGDWQGMLDPNSKDFLGRSAPQYLTNQKNAPASTDLYGTQQGGYRFIGHTAADWKNQKMWVKQ